MGALDPVFDIDSAPRARFRGPRGPKRARGPKDETSNLDEKSTTIDEKDDVFLLLGPVRGGAGTDEEGGVTRGPRPRCQVAPTRTRHHLHFLGSDCTSLQKCAKIEV